MEELRQSTVDAVVVGPLLDASGNPVTTATLSDFSILKDSGADLGSATVLTGATVSHIDEGYYKIIWTTGNTDTLGRLYLITNNSSYSMAPGVYMVVLAELYDAKYVTAPSSAGGMVVVGTTANTFKSDSSANVTAVDLAAVKAKTDNLPDDPADASVIAGRFDTLDTAIGDLPTNAELTAALASSDDATLAAIAALNDLASNDVTTACISALTTAAAESYRGTGATGSPIQLLYEIVAHLGEHVISGTTKTTKKLDGSTTAKTYTLNDATTPTGITEAT